MNGIVHQSTHPDDKVVNSNVTLDDMFSTIAAYIEHLFNLIKPTNTFYMAIDGVAPKAKMNQQRSRRFRSAQERIENMKKAAQKGEAVDENAFDSNCITPGTEFMESLHSFIQEFICDKKCNDPAWTNVTVIYSGHNVPGEGEHKIQEYIRYMRSLPDYNPCTTHCYYGLDADLIMLGLSTHEPHVYLLREKVHYGKTSKFNKNEPQNTRFEILSIATMRLYIHQEFSEISGLPDYNLEHLIDDWIFMTFFLGCDFIPHMPNIDILEGGLTDMWRAYINVKPNMNGYLLDNGFINSRNVLMFISELSRSNQGSQYRSNYYKTKLDLEMNEQNMKFIAHEFFQALHWVTHYYFFGVVSWDWYYPALYSPFIADLLSLNPEEIDDAFNFNLDPQPVLPFEQLLSVLPPQSSALLPEGFKYIMFDSPCDHFYPQSFHTDPNGKKRKWEHIVIIPFVDSEMIRYEMGCAYSNLTEEECQRNSHGNFIVYTLDDGKLDVNSFDKDFFKLTVEQVTLDLLEGSNPEFYDIEAINEVNYNKLRDDTVERRYRNSKNRHGKGNKKDRSSNNLKTIDEIAYQQRRYGQVNNITQGFNRMNMN